VCRIALAVEVAVPLCAVAEPQLLHLFGITKAPYHRMSE
jgi:hypothetical protein